jgi:hypothetical protein
MRNFLSSIICCFLSAAALQAQEYNAKKDFLIGVKVIPGISNMTKFSAPLETYNTHTKFVFSGGVQLTKGIINNNIYLSLEALYLNRGYTATVIKDDPFLTKNDTLNRSENMYFASFPINILYAYRNFYLGGGIFFNYFLHSKYISYNRTTFPQKHNDHQMLLGSQVKVGYRYKFRNANVLMTELYVDHAIKSGINNFGLAISYNFKLNK